MGTHRATALLLVFWAAGSSPEAAKPSRIAAVTRDAEGKPRPAEFLEEARKGAIFEIGYLDEDQRRAAVRTALGRDIDLLPGRLDEVRRGYMVFVLKVTNTSSEDLMFNPGHSRLAADKEDISFALDYAALYEAVHRLGPSAPTLEEMATIIFDRAVTIKPAGSVRKLIIFESPKEERFRELTVRLLEIGVGSESFDVIFPFRRFPIETTGGS